MAIDITQYVIRNNINNQISLNIIDLKNLKEMQNKYNSIIIFP